MTNLETKPFSDRSADVLLSVDSLSVEFKIGRATLQAVNAVSFELYRGETLGLVGESGCGKSTTGRAVMSIVSPSSGVVRLDGDDLARLKPKELAQSRRRMQMIFQDPISSLNPRRRVGDIIAEGLRIWAPRRRSLLMLAAIGCLAGGITAALITIALGRSSTAFGFVGLAIVGALLAAFDRAGFGQPDPADLEERVAEVLDAVGLDPETASLKRPHQFSGGQCQRISIARALVTRPDIIICDEPVAALDVSVQAQILNLLEDLKERYQLSLIFIAHDLAVVRNVSDRVAVMYLGRICEIGPSRELFDQPAHPYTRMLIDVIPKLDPLDETRSEASSVGEVPSPLHPPSGCPFRTRCPKAQAVCAEQVPPLVEVAPQRRAACHFPL